MIEELIAQVARDGEQRHSSWNRDVFARWAAQARKFDAKSDKLARAYLEMVREGIASGMLTGGKKKSRQPSNLLELALYRAPKDLASTSPKKAIEILAAAWNLAEGLHEEPAWMSDYVLSRTTELESIEHLAPWLKSALQPVLEDTTTSTFSRDFAVQVLDFRPFEPTFLPGEMALLAPRVAPTRTKK
jgi:hypothetical protein